MIPAPQRVRIEADDDAPDTATLRAQRVVYLMTLGKWMYVEEVAAIAGLSVSGAQKLLDRMAGSKHVPVTCVRVGRKLLWGIGSIDARDFAW